MANRRSDVSLPRIALAIFCASILVGALLYRGHSVDSVDVRTYAQMVRGVVDHGIPCWDNGPLDRFPLVVQHAAPAHGLVCGVYGPLYAYVGAPALELGSFTGLAKLTIALLIPIAIATFILARRFVESEWTAAFAGMLVVVSTPILGKATETTGFPIAILMAIIATHFTVCTIEGEKRGVHAGVAWAAACAAHLVTFPMATAALAIIGLAVRRPLLHAIAGFAIGLFPVALLNHFRFGLWNPISYGRPPWSGPVGMSFGDQIAYCAPVFALVAVASALLYWKRTSRAALLVIAAGTLVFALAVPELRMRSLRILAVAIGYVVDISFFTFHEFPYSKTADGIGLLHIDKTAVTKSTLQCTPLLLLAPLALRGVDKTKRWSVLALLLPSAALYLSLFTRANMDWLNAFGVPWHYHRYTLPAFPGFLVAAVIVVEKVKLSRPLVAGIAIVGLVVAYVFSENRDVWLLKRLAVLALPLLLATASFVAILRRWRPAPLLVSGTIALGIAMGVGQDLHGHLYAKRFTDGMVDDFTRHTPQKFALVGGWRYFDPLLTTSITHDVRYVDIVHFQPYFAGLRPLLELWRAEGRTIFLHAPFDVWKHVPASPWPDVKFTLLPDTQDIYRMDFEDPPAAAVAP